MKEIGTLTELQETVRYWASRNFPNAESWEPLVGMQEELGELSHAHLKLHQGIRGTAAEHQEAKADAVGDVVIFLCHYCSLNGLDLRQCVQDALSQVLQRDWQKRPKTG